MHSGMSGTLPVHWAQLPLQRRLQVTDNCSDVCEAQTLVAVREDGEPDDDFGVRKLC